MTENNYLRIVYRVLAYGIGLVFIIALVTDAMNHPHNGGVPRILGLLLIAVLALVWVWVSSLGKEARARMGVKR